MAKSFEFTPTLPSDQSLIDTVERSFLDSTVSNRILSLIDVLTKHLHELSPVEQGPLAAKINEKLTTEITIDTFLQEWDRTHWWERLSLCQKWWDWTIGSDWSSYKPYFEYHVDQQDHSSLLQVLEYYLKARMPHRKRSHFWEGLAKHPRFCHDADVVERFTVSSKKTDP